MRNAEQANREVMAFPKVESGIKGKFTAWSNARKVKSLKKQLHAFLDHCYGKDLNAVDKKAVWVYANKTEKPTFNSIQKRYLEAVKLRKFI